MRLERHRLGVGGIDTVDIDIEPFLEFVKKTAFVSD
jgi:hypothetical protein